MDYPDERALSETYVDALARRLAVRLRRGEPLREALGATLEAEAPVTLLPEETSSGSSTLRWLVGMGVLAAAAVGLNYAAQLMLGKDLVSLAQDQLGGDDEPGYDIDQKYPTVHGTSGAEMPKPAAAPHAHNEGPPPPPPAPGAGALPPTDRPARPETPRTEEPPQA